MLADDIEEIVEKTGLGVRFLKSLRSSKVMGTIQDAADELGVVNTRDGCGLLGASTKSLFTDDGVDLGFFGTNFKDNLVAGNFSGIVTNFFTFSVISFVNDSWDRSWGNSS
jgi:hypothetical protein